MIAAYAFSHFAVDFGCAFAVFSQGLGPWELLLYNMFAFAMQMPLGLLADTVKHSKHFALLGTATVGVCCLLPGHGPLFACLLGLGNGLFHIGGGLDVMERFPDRAGPLGGFVAPGAMGVYLGTVLGKGGQGVFPVLAALLCGLLWLLLCRKRSEHISRAPIKLPSTDALLPAALLFLVVALRSVGGTAELPWKVDTLAVAAVCAVVFGKMLGGILSDLLGPVPVSVGSLLLAGVLFFLADRPLPGLMALLLFNMTMPITLFVLSRILPGVKGLAFGLLTFALFVGFLPSFFGAPAITPMGMLLLCALSALLLLPALKAGEHL